MREELLHADTHCTDDRLWIPVRIPAGGFTHLGHKGGGGRVGEAGGLWLYAMLMIWTRCSTRVVATSDRGRNKQQGLATVDEAQAQARGKEGGETWR